MRAEWAAGTDHPAGRIAGREHGEPADGARGKRAVASLIVILGVGALLWRVADQDYSAFHLLTEIAVVVILFTVFTIAWRTRHHSSNGYLTLIGMSALSLGVITVFHALTYKGMPVLQSYGTNLPTELWLASRYLTAAAFLIAPLFIARKLDRPGLALLVFGAIAAVYIALILLGVAPDAYVEGSGLTPFKIYSEYVIIALFAIAAAALLWKRRSLPRGTFGLLAGSLACAIVAESLFTTYASPFALSNMFGHFAYLLSFYLIYLALVDYVLARPYAALYAELARSEAELREAHAFAHGLNRINSAVNSTLAPEEILQRVTDLAGEVVGADAAVVAVYERDRFAPKFFWGYTGAEFGDMTLGPDTGRHMFESAGTGEPVVSEDASRDPRVSPRLVEATGVTSLITNALMVKGEIIGTLGLHWRGTGHRPTPAEVEFTKSASAAVAAALENAYSFVGAREVAEVLQSDMASGTERAESIEIGHVYVPAPGPGRIGGDFYDMFMLDDGRHAFVLGDVAGRGLIAATTSARTRAFVRAFAYLDPDPSFVLSNVSKTLAHQLADTSFVTAVYGVLDSRSGDVSVMLAGHPEPIVVGGSVHLCPADCVRTPLGIEGAQECPPWVFRLEPEATLILYTDGVIETRDGSELFGVDRLKVVAEAAAALPTAQDVADAVIDAVGDFASGRLSDDIAVLTIRLA